MPVKDGVMYMPVPRCDSCRWWAATEWEDRPGECHHPGNNPPDGMMCSNDGYIFTRADFGCVQWERKAE
jgi:hypothetical protein